MELLPDEGLMVEIEDRAVSMAREAGKILQSHFGMPLEVEYKDKNKRDPVSSADKGVQAYLCEAISRCFPHHGILGEEGPQEDEAPAPDLLWVLDPLDGTTNFLSGLPVYAASIGVLYRGRPIAAALFIPWPGESGGFVLHAHSGGGASVDGERLSISQSEGPEGKRRLIGLPASLGARFRLRKGLRQCVGELRVTGSIAYELALTVCGAFKYVVFGGPRIWDVAAGALVVVEAGGAVLVRYGESRSWEPLTYLGPSWDSGPPSLKRIRNWVAPLIAGTATVAPFVAANLQTKYPLRARLGRLIGKLGHGVW